MQLAFLFSPIAHSVSHRVDRDKPVIERRILPGTKYRTMTRSTPYIIPPFGGTSLLTGPSVVKTSTVNLYDKRKHTWQQFRQELCMYFEVVWYMYDTPKAMLMYRLFYPHLCFYSPKISATFLSCAPAVLVFISFSSALQRCPPPPPRTDSIAQTLSRSVFAPEFRLQEMWCKYIRSSTCSYLLPMDERSSMGPRRGHNFA